MMGGTGQGARCVVFLGSTVVWLSGRSVLESWSEYGVRSTKVEKEDWRKAPRRETRVVYGGSALAHCVACMGGAVGHWQSPQMADGEAGPLVLLRASRLGLGGGGV